VQFAPVVGPMLESALRRTATLWRDRETWRRVQANGMACDVSWRASARLYAELHRGLVAERTG
jgi:starch synthase